MERKHIHMDRNAWIKLMRLVARYNWSLSQAYAGNADLVFRVQECYRCHQRYMKKREAFRNRKRFSQ